LLDAKEELKRRIEYCNRFGYMHLDHYAIRELTAKIDMLMEQIKNEQGHS